MHDYGMASETIYDIYVLKTSGIPIFAGCTGTSYCQGHRDQHELHAGFFSALYMFSKENHIGSGLDSILFKDIQINFKIDEDADIILALVHPRGVDERTAHKHVDTAFDILMKRYIQKIDIHTPNPSFFSSYRRDLFDAGITSRENLVQTGAMQLDRESVLKRWLKKLRL